MTDNNQTDGRAWSSTGKLGKRSADDSSNECGDYKRYKGAHDEPVEILREDRNPSKTTYITTEKEFTDAVESATKYRLDPTLYNQHQRDTLVDSAVLVKAVQSYFADKQNLRSMLVGDAVLRERDLTFAENVHQSEKDCSDALSKFIKEVGTATTEYNTKEYNQVFGRGRGFDSGSKPDFASAMKILEAIDQAKSVLHETAKGCDSRSDDAAWPKPTTSLHMGNESFPRSDRREDLMEMEQINKQRIKYRADFVSTIGKFEADMGKAEAGIVWGKPEDQTMRGEFSIKLSRACKEISDKEKNSISNFEDFIKREQSRAQRGR